ncbi:hypothetical protein C4587_01835 [Candidatus Parcubacteria bacterium]|nr:MAG: hypothetical protein C4587_01835 [Candidatus Parcubacteria bacterium]
MSNGYKPALGDFVIPNQSQLGDYKVTLDAYEGITQSLYDFQTYGSAGQTQLNFFAVPVGQGGKTNSDTNMQLAGQLPANLRFLITGIEVQFRPTIPTVAAAMPAVYGADAVAAQINDAYIVERAGNLQLTIGSKQYLQEAPLGRLPGRQHFHLDAAVSGTQTATGTQSRIAFGYASGAPYNLRSPLLLLENMAFSVVLAWPEGVQAITNPGRIGVILNGVLYRLAQ